MEWIKFKLTYWKSHGNRTSLTNTGWVFLTHKKGLKCWVMEWNLANKLIFLLGIGLKVDQWGKYKLSFRERINTLKVMNKWSGLN